jgi:hypothetical protein
LVYFDPWIAGVVIPNLIIVGLMAIPYIDTSPKGIGYYTWKERPFANANFTLGMILWFALIGIGYYCRGPNYFWYWPWESWLMHKSAPPPTWSIFGPAGAAKFPLWLGVPVVGAFTAASMFLPRLVKAEIPSGKAHAAFFGAMAVAILGAKLGFGVPFAKGVWLLVFGWFYFYFNLLLPQRHIRELDWARYLVTMFLVVSTVAILLKMGARLAFDIKYILTVPSVNLNI